MRPDLGLAAMAAILFLAPTGAFAAPATAGETAGPPISLPWRASGNEPGWQLTFDAERMVFRPMSGAAVEAPLPKPAHLADRWVYRSEPHDLTVSVKVGICRDSMSGMPRPFGVGVTTGGQTLTGCGGNPSDLIAGTWHVVVIGGKPVPGDIDVTLDFDVAAGQVSGSSGCNRYFGGFALTGEGLTFKPGMAGSMMACEAAATMTEQTFQAALASVQRFDIDEHGRLDLLSHDGIAIRAARDPKD